MMDKNIGYIINETASTPEPYAKIVKGDGRRVVAEVILQDMDTKNRNGRFYSHEELIPELTCKRQRELIDSQNMFGEEGHPVQKDIARQQTVLPEKRCHLILKLWTEGKLVKAYVRGSNTCHGEAFNQDLLDGGKPSFSLRALGSIVNTSRGAEVKNLKVITWDRVIYPSHEAAYTVGLVDGTRTEATNIHESASMGLNRKSDGIVSGNMVYVTEQDSGLLVPINNKNVVDYIKQESANVKNVLKSFDTLYESATLISNGSQVQLVSKTGDTMIINLENYIQNDIMDYCKGLV